MSKATMREVAEVETKIAEAFFEAIPSPEDYDDTGKMNVAVNLMAQRSREMRNLAISAKSLVLLHKAGLMAEETTRVFGLLSARYKANHKPSGLVGAMGNPISIDSEHWVK